MDIKLGLLVLDEAWSKKVAKLFENCQIPSFDVEIFNSEVEALKAVKSEKFDAFLATFPVLVCELYKRGYHPVAKHPEVKEEDYLLISKESFETLREKKSVVVGLLRHPSTIGLLIPLQLRLKIEPPKLWYIWEESYHRLMEVLEEGRVDCIIVPEKVAKEHPKLNELFKSKVPIKRFYYLMAKARLLKDGNFLKELSSCGFKRLRFWEKHNIFSYCFLSRYFPKLLEQSINASNLLKAPHYGVLVYQERFVWANEYALRLLKYSLKDFRKLVPSDIIFYEEDKKVVEEVVRKRLRGEFLGKEYKDLVFKAKDGSKLFVRAYSTTILYHGRFSGLVIFVNVTEEKKLERLYRVLKDVNQILISCRCKHEVFKKILPVLVEELELKGAWIGGVNEKEGVVEFLYGYPDYVKTTLEAVEMFKKGILFLEKTPFVSVVRAVKDKKPFIVPEVKKFCYPAKAKAYGERIGVNSICVLPVIVKGKVVNVLSMWTDELGFFTEKIRDLLEELQKDLAFALEKIELTYRDFVIGKFVQNSNEFVIICDINGFVEHINPAGERLFNLLPGSKVDSIKELKSIVEELSREKKKQLSKIVIYSKEEKNIPLEVKASVITLPGDVKKILVWGRDLHERVELENRRRWYLDYDILTGVLNYYGFFLELQKLCNRCKKGILVFLDIYKFSTINHFYGRKTGDRCLKEIAKRLREVAEVEEGIVGRVGANTFAVFFPLKKEAYYYIQKVTSALKLPVIVGDREVSLEFYGGVLFYPQDAKSVKELYEKAFVFLKRVKAKEALGIQLLNPQIEKEIHGYFNLEKLIEEAFRNDAFVFFYQPYVKAKTYQIAGFESLVRIKKGNRLVPPDEFIDFLEDSVYLKDFELVSLYKNIKKIKEWKIPISINISVRSFNSGYIVELLKHHREEIKKLPAPLTVEITEHKLGEDLGKIKEVLSYIQENFNVEVALDDFGTGYSSLHYLKDLPIRVLKVDKVFTSEVLTNERTYFILKTILSLAKTLDLKVVAEGIEFKDQLKVLEELGCDYFQGYLFSAPVPEEEVPKLLKSPVILPKD